jgi:hypothetical protein
VLFLFSVFVLVNSLFSSHLSVTLFKWLRVLEVLLLGFYISRRGVFFGKNVVSNAVVASVAVVSVVGILQFWLGETIGGLFTYLGERTFSLSTPGIALVQINGIDYLRAYSIFPHPNALAGYIVVSLFFLLSGGFNKNKYFGIYITLAFVCFALTFSLSAVIGLLICFAFYVSAWRGVAVLSTTIWISCITIILSLTMPLVSGFLINNNYSFSNNIMERLSLSVSAGELLSNNFLFGTGLNTFIPNLRATVSGGGLPLLLQPVHNIFLLAASETGVVGLLGLSYIIYAGIRKLFKYKNTFYLLTIVFIVTTGFFDHYWLTIQQNLLLMGLVFGTALSKN